MSLPPDTFIDLRELSAAAAKLLAAAILAMPIAWNRARETRIMGLRTYPLVSISSCAFVLIGLSFMGEGDVGARTRIIQGLLAGIGFIGGGAILKNDDSVKGTASAASILAVGAVGTAVVIGTYEIALLVSILTFLILRYLTGYKIGSDDQDSTGV